MTDDEDGHRRDDTGFGWRESSADDAADDDERNGERGRRFPHSHNEPPQCSAGCVVVLAETTTNRHDVRRDHQKDTDQNTGQRAGQEELSR